MANILLKKHSSISSRRKDVKRKGKKGRKRKEKTKEITQPVSVLFPS